jgi:ABC-type tungstate transport system permease subunit
MARRLMEWLTSPEVKRKIAAFRKRGRQLFTPLYGP